MSERKGNVVECMASSARVRDVSAGSVVTSKVKMKRSAIERKASREKKVRKPTKVHLYCIQHKSI